MQFRNFQVETGIQVEDIVERYEKDWREGDCWAHN